MINTTWAIVKLFIVEPNFPLHLATLKSQKRKSTSTTSNSTLACYKKNSSYIKHALSISSILFYVTLVNVFAVTLKETTKVP
jgi:hypothetical protein